LNWTVETATHAHRIICSGVFDAYPKAMMILGHMGELLPFSMERFDQGWQFYAGNKAKHQITGYMRKSLFITTSGNVSPVSLTGAVMKLREREGTVRQVGQAVSFGFPSAVRYDLRSIVLTTAIDQRIIRSTNG
jgi:predicted TIM-barrel fold metal-dependent hydrolase